MNFGEEGERLQAQRNQANRQYAEDLRRQIEEQSQKPKTPSLEYGAFFNQNSNAQNPSSLAPSNYNNNYNSNYNSNYNQNNYNTLNNNTLRNNVSNNNNINSNINNYANPSNNQSNVPAVRNPSNHPQILQPSNRLQARQSPRLLQPLPDLQPVPNPGPSPDAIRFADRLNWLEASVDQHQSILRAASDATTRIEQQSIPSLESAVETLRSAIERISSVDLPNRVRPLEEENTHLEEKITAAVGEYAQISQQMRDSLTEMSSNLSQAESKFNDFSDTAKSTIVELKQNITVARESAEQTAQKVAANESHALSTEEQLRSTTTYLSNFEKSSQEGLIAAQTATNSAIQSASLTLAKTLEEETAARTQSTAILQDKASQVSSNASSHFQQLQHSISELALTYKQSLNNISNSVKKQLSDMRNDADSRYAQQMAQIDQLFSDVDSNFKRVQDSSVATLTALNERAIQARSSLETALTDECKARKDFEQEIVARYDNFKTVIMNEMQLQTAQMEASAEEATQKAIDICNEKLIPLKKEVADIRAKAKRMELLPQKVSTVENLVNQLNQQLIESAERLNSQASNVNGKIEKVRGDADSSIDNFNERLQILEENAVKPDYASRQEVSDAFSRLGTDFDGRMQEIEQQIGVIFSTLSDLTMSMPAVAQVREPGAALVEKLASEAQ